MSGHARSLSRQARRRARPAAVAAAAVIAVASTVLATGPRASADTGGTNQIGFQTAIVSNGTVWIAGCTWSRPDGQGIIQGGCGAISNLGVAVAPGTSPSIAAVPGSVFGTAGSSQAAWQGANNHLWITGPGGPADTGLAMMPHTSPTLTVLPPGNNLFLPGGGAVVVFQGADGHPWFYTASDSRAMSASLLMAPGTSPAVIPAPNAGGWQAVWQGTNNDLWTTSPLGPRDLGWKMMPGTSPSLAELTNGLFAAAISAYNGPGVPGTMQVTVGAILNPASAATTSPGPYPGWGMAPGTSPSISSTPPTPIDPNPADLWEATFNGLDGRLWGDGSLVAGPVITPRTPGGFALAPGSSPAVMGTILPSYLGAGATPGYVMLYPDVSGNLHFVVGSAFTTKYIDPASPFGPPVSAGTSPSAASFQ